MKVLNNYSNRIKGLYCDKVVALNKSLDTTTEKTCILLEELGHHYTSSGDILDLSVVQNRKQERLARIWAYNKQIGLNGLINAYEHGCRNRHEIAEYLEVTESFLQEAVDCYHEKINSEFDSESILSTEENSEYDLTTETIDEANTENDDASDSKNEFISNNDTSSENDTITNSEPVADDESTQNSEESEERATTAPEQSEETTTPESEPTTETPNIEQETSSIETPEPEQTPEATVTPPQTSESVMVWVDDTAAKYHSKNGCGMDNPYQVTLEEAIAMGKTPCGRCYK